MRARPIALTHTSRSEANSSSSKGTLPCGCNDGRSFPEMNTRIMRCARKRVEGNRKAAKPRECRYPLHADSGPKDLPTWVVEIDCARDPKLVKLLLRRAPQGARD
jgi:hypothetical protein